MTAAELQVDIDELLQLQNHATRQRVKDILATSIKSLETERDRVLQSQASQANGAQSLGVKLGSVPVPKTRCTVDITTYGWDQSDKFMKIYVTSNGVQKNPAENVTSSFTERSMKLRIQDLEGKDYLLEIRHLFDDIIPTESYHKVKTDMVLVMLKKKEQKKTWAYVTETENKIKEKKKPKLDDKDPGEGLMQMMKQMYEDGDDEMKRTIAKAWTESQTKQSAMNM
ncbi:calcyclin-binding protein [Lingula anatina]|uniref:Calcyclin-binding protein n=1 Tax=Lingula anatina TaxID=7574 RepID=A0A1S3KBE0_LINAN|nr:calcyclin-binding protein [Lingula anatina]|eukprot:XP_013419953.1 calcyclin-binding protein [Lingula anatina]